MNQLVKLIGLSLAIAAVIVVITAVSLRNPSFQRLMWPFLISILYSTSIGGLSWWTLARLAPRFSHVKTIQWSQLVGILTVNSFLGGTFAYLVMVWQPFVRIQIEYIPSMLTCLIITQLIGCISFVVEEAKHKVQATTLQLQTRELERERALKAASEAKLQSLESRIHPHFLFNTLNSISSLVRSNPTEAEVLIERLAALLRFSLDRHGSLVSLADEMQITRDYLNIEKTRFGDRLRYHFEIPAELLDAKVPAMSLQTLAENSVKYAVGSQRQGADIFIRARRNGPSIQLEVADSGPGFSPDSLPSGHGLDTLRQRLESLFGDRATLNTRRLDPGMEVAFTVPC